MQQNVYHVVGSPDLFVSKAKEQELVAALQSEIKALIQACYPDVPMLADVIESEGLPVLQHGPDMQLKLMLLIVGAEPGFIAPTLPKYADFVKSLKKIFPHKAHLDFSNGVLLALDDMNHYTFLAYHFYHWMAYRRGFKGYQPEAQKLYTLFSRKFNGQLHPKLLENLSFEETDLLKIAIRRDKEALQFVRHLVHQVFIPGNNAKLLETGEAQA